MNRIRELRKARGITMKQLGEAIGLAESTISHYETGRRQPDNEALFKLGDYFNVPLGYLLGSEVKDQYSAKFREELFCRLERDELSGDEDCACYEPELREIVNSEYPLSFAEACDAAEKAGISIDDLIWDNADNIPDNSKKSPGTDKSVPGDEQDKEIMCLVAKMTPEQKVLLLALLRTTLGQSQGTPASGQVSST